MSLKGLHHLGLAVKSLDKTTEFFTSCLNFEVAKQVPSYPANFVTNGHVFITLWQTNNYAIEFDRKQNIGLHHFALRVESESKLHSLYEKTSRYPEVKVDFAPELLGDGPSQHFMIFEPGGIRIEFIYTTKGK